MALRETLTRNDQCSTIDELLECVYEWTNTDWCFCNQELTDYAFAA
jgi:hypothetical protein